MLRKAPIGVFFMLKNIKFNAGGGKGSEIFTQKNIDNIVKAIAERIIGKSVTKSSGEIDLGGKHRLEVASQ